MPNDARERTEWKVRIADWIDGLPTLIKRPVRKLMAGTVIGILTSGSLRQSEIARALKRADPASPHPETAVAHAGPARQA